jgi:dienelactone hydrolase
MQRGGQASVFATQPCAAVFPLPAGCGRWPMLLFSHGLAGSPVDGKSIDFLVRLASYGYVVSAPFHGDGRFSRLKVEDVGDLFYIVRNFDRIVEMQAMRPVSAKAVIDLMLAHPDFGARIDATRIGGIGGSMGGATMTWLLGAQLTDNYPRLTAKATVQDPRIKAAVGYVPYAGQSFLPAFGDDNATAKNVTAPYLSISGTSDTTAPMFMMEQAVNNFRGARYQVALSGVEHTYESSYANDVFGWAIPFFAAYLNGDKSALDRLSRQRNVSGGLNDYLRIDYVPPTALVSGEVLVDEFYNTIVKRHFITASGADKDAIDRGSAGAGWIRTGYQFKAYTIPGPAELRVATQAPVCRMYATAQNTHFYSTSPLECQMLRASRAWIDEGVAFWINTATQTSCGTGTLAVIRLSDSRWRESTSNHRYVTSNSQVEDMKANGWYEEGVVMCAPL